MKKILLAIFLMLLSIWCLIFGTLDDVTLFLFIGVYLPIVAVIIFIVGYFEKNQKNQ